MTTHAGEIFSLPQNDNSVSVISGDSSTSSQTEQGKTRHNKTRGNGDNRDSSCGAMGNDCGRKRVRRAVQTRTCEQCRKIFGVLSRGSPARFCSLSCSSTANAAAVTAKYLKTFLHHGNDARQKRYCHSTVQAAVTSGRVIRPTRCDLCSKPCKPEAAHIDYSQPYMIAWLCVKCHRGSHHDSRMDMRVRLLAKLRNWPHDPKARPSLVLARNGGVE